MTSEPLVLPPSRAERLALRALQVGAIAVVLVASTYRTFELDRFFVPKELVLHATALAAGVLAAGAARRVRATRVDALLVGFLVLSALSAAFATNRWVAARALGISVSGIVVFWAARGVAHAGLSRPLIRALALAVVLVAATALLQAYGLETELFSANRAPGGTLGNRNFVAHVAAFGLPLLVLSALRAWRWAGFALGAVGVMIAVGTLVLTRSRAAWLALLAVLGVVLIGGLLSGPVRRHGRTLARLLLLLLFVGGGAAVAVALPNALEWRSETPYLETARGVVNYREGSGRGRLIQYGNTLRMALAHPLLGVGPGNWGVEYPGFAAPDDPSRDPNEEGMTANPWPSSDWMALIAERGLVAFGLLVLAWVGMVVAGWRTLRGARDFEEGLMALALLAILVGTAIAGAFDAVLLLAWPTLLFWAAVGALWPPEAVRGVDAGPRARVAALLALTLLSGLGAARTAGQLAAMGIYASDGGRRLLELASRLDPGSYPVHLSLARSYRGDSREARCEHARAAHALYPHAAAARRLADRCD